MKTVMVGSQTGNREDYELLRELCDEGTILVDDTNPLELAAFIKEKRSTCSSAASRSGRSPTSWASASATTTTSASSPGRIPGNAQFRRRGARLGDEPGVAVRRQARQAQRSRHSQSRNAGLLPRRSLLPNPSLHWLCSTAVLRSRVRLHGRFVMQPLPLVDDPPQGFTATRNACHVCTPLGACLVFRGIEGAIPLLHGSQGCSTYIRRYMIGHFREPMDIASSNFSESAAIYGGGANFRTGAGERHPPVRSRR